MDFSVFKQSRTSFIALLVHVSQFNGIFILVTIKSGELCCELDKPHQFEGKMDGWITQDFSTSSMWFPEL